MLTRHDYENAAKTIGCDTEAIMAVDQVESNGNGFLSTGEPVILFEPHIFWKELRKRNIDPTQFIKGNEDILYPTWGTKPYGPINKQHQRLEHAAKINRDAALSSASWGRFQIMGYNYKLCGYSSLQDFINDIYKDETKHLLAFTRYIKNTFLDDELRNHDWAGFARGYNGPMYTKNQYHIKLKKAYENVKSKM